MLFLQKRGFYFFFISTLILNMPLIIDDKVVEEPEKTLEDFEEFLRVSSYLWYPFHRVMLITMYFVQRSCSMVFKTCSNKRTLNGPLIMSSLLCF